jgi:hypothetical protein
LEIFEKDIKEREKKNERKIRAGLFHFSTIENSRKFFPFFPGK